MDDIKDKEFQKEFSNRLGKVVGDEVKIEQVKNSGLYNGPFVGVNPLVPDKIEFLKFKKIPRLSRTMVLTEKIDGTSGCIYIGENGEFLTGKRSGWCTVENDNFGFAKWANENKADLILNLGVGRHFGEFWGCGIQRRYGLDHKRFSLFNTKKWNNETKPDCCHVVPVLYEGEFDTIEINYALTRLKQSGSIAVSGFMKPEGIVIYHVAAGVYFKKTIEKDEEYKGKNP